MENRVVGMLAVFLFIVCFAVGVSYFFEIDSRRAEYQQAKERVESHRGALANKHSQLDSIRAQYDQAREIYDRHNRLSESKTKLTREIAELNAAKDGLAAQFAGYVEKVRSNMEGVDLGVITLATGQGLQAAKVQKAGDGEVTFSHSQGVTKVAAENLPADLRQKFRYSMIPFTLLKPGLEPKAPVAAATPDAPRATSLASSLTKVNKIQVEIDQKMNNIGQLEQSRLQWMDKASQLRRQASSAQFNGRPSFAFNAQATQCDQNAEQISQQMLKLRNEIASLQADMSNAAAGR